MSLDKARNWLWLRLSAGRPSAAPVVGLPNEASRGRLLNPKRTAVVRRFRAGCSCTGGHRRRALRCEAFAVGKTALSARSARS
eukprot:3121744-Pleurochrysis_carterae.AAC.4